MDSKFKQLAKKRMALQQYGIVTLFPRKSGGNPGVTGHGNPKNTKAKRKAQKEARKKNRRR